MNELPRSVREAMARQSAAGAHPDADLLTAFTEGSATEWERQAVLAHLATCSECREVVALTATEAQEQTVLRPEPHRMRRWLWIPALGAVAVVTLSTALLLNLQTPTARRTTESAGVSSAPAPLSTPSAPQQYAASKDELKRNEAVAENAPQIVAPKSAAKKSGGTPEREKDKNAEPAAQPAIAARTVPSPNASPIIADSRGDQQSKAQAGAVVGGVLSAPSSSASSLHGTAGAINSNTVTGPYAQNVQSQNLQNQAVQSQSALKVESNNVSAERDTAQNLAKNKSIRDEAMAVPAAPPAMGMRPQKPARVPTNGTLAKAAPAAVVSTRWRINPAGSLERAIASGPWMPELPEERFTVVSTIVSDVWAAANSGSLYHSRDNGEHWTRVAISEKGVFLSGAITGIRFEDVNRGEVQTDKGESWVTTDAGATWSRAR